MVLLYTECNCFLIREVFVLRLKRLLFGILLPAILVAALAACSANTGSLKVRDVFETSKHITLGQYKGIKTDLEAPKEITPEDIERSKYSVLIKNAKQSYESPLAAEKWDTVYFYYKATSDGNVISEGDGNQYVNVGTGEFLLEFENELIGLKKGDKKSVTVTVPETYSDSSLWGKVVTFDVEITAVYKNELPNFDDEFVFKNFGYAGVSVFEQKQREKLQKQRDENYNDRKKSQVWQKVVKNCTINSYPNEELSLYTSREEQYYSNYAAYFSLTQDEISRRAVESANKELSHDMIAYAIAVKESLSVSTEEQAVFRQQLLDSAGYKTESELISDTSGTLAEYYGGTKYVERYFIRQKVMQFCADNAVE